MSNKYQCICFAAVITFSMFIFTDKANAQDIGTGVAIPVKIAENANEGSLICSSSTGYRLCDSANSDSIFGVVVASPSANFGEIADIDEKFVLTNGIAKVRIKENTQIQSGDLISISDTPGVGSKASKNGFVVGNAIEELQSTQNESSVFVTIGIHYTTAFTDSRSNLFQILSDALRTPVLTPLTALRYIVAAAVVISSFILAFIFFGRIAKAGIESVARNPLAKSRIQFIVLINTLITVAIFIVGLGLAYIILAI